MVSAWEAAQIQFGVYWGIFTHLVALGVGLYVGYQIGKAVGMLPFSTQGAQATPQRAGTTFITLNPPQGQAVTI